MEQKAFITDDALEVGIESLKHYSDQLTEFDKKTKEAFAVLGQTHRDQNYEEFRKYFLPFWSKVEEWKKEVDVFDNYLVKKKEEMLTEWVSAGKIK